MNTTAMGHMHPYSNRIMWRTSVNVFNEAKRSGVALDFKTYRAIMHSLTVHTRKKDSSGVPFRSKKVPCTRPASLDISSVPSLGIWKPIKKEAGIREIQLEKKAQNATLSLGEAPRASKPLSFITEMTSLSSANSTPSIFNGPIVLSTTKRAPRGKLEKEKLISSEPDSLKLQIPGMVKLMQSKKDRAVVQGMGDLGASISRIPQINDEPATEFCALDLPRNSRSEIDALAGKNTEGVMHPSDTLEILHTEDHNERYRKSLNLHHIPAESTTKMRSMELSTEDPHRAPNIDELTNQWEDRREAESKEHARLAAIAYERDEKRRLNMESQEKSRRWARERGVQHSVLPKKTNVDPVAYQLSFTPSVQIAWNAFRNSQATNTLTNEHVRIMLQRLSANNSISLMSSLLQEVQRMRVDGVGEHVRYFSLLHEYHTGGYSRVTSLFAEMEAQKSRVNRRALILTMLASVRCDSSGGWQRSTELYCKYKPITNDPLQMIELNFIQSLCLSNMRSKEVRSKVLEMTCAIHNLMKNSMNHIGKLHSSALIRAYVKAGDSGTAHSILKGFQAQGDADQVMYANVLASCSQENIQDIIATFVEGKEVIESDLLAAIMCTYANRDLVHEAWSLLSKAIANRDFEIRGSRLPYAILMCIESEGNASASHVKVAHDVLIKCGLYNDRTLQRMVPFFQRNEMHSELVAAMANVDPMYQKNLAPAHIVAYQQACKNSKMHQLKDTRSLPQKCQATSSDANVPREQLNSSASADEEFDEKLMHLAKCGDWQMAVSIVADMQSHRMTLKPFFYNCVLTAAKDQCHIVEKVLKNMAIFHVEPNTVTINLAMNAFKRMKKWDKVYEIYRNSKELIKDATSYYLAVAAIGHSGRWEESIGLLQEAQRRNIRLNQEIMNEIYQNVETSPWHHGLKVLEIARSLKGIEIDTQYEASLVKKMTESGVQNANDIVALASSDRRRKPVKKKKTG